MLESFVLAVCRANLVPTISLSDHAAMPVFYRLLNADLISYILFRIGHAALFHDRGSCQNYSGDNRYAGVDFAVSILKRRRLMSADVPSESIVHVFRNEFLFHANRPEHAGAVSKRMLRIAHREELVFDSAVMYQKAGSGGLSRIVVKFVSPTRIVLIESRPTAMGPEATVILEEQR